MTKVWGDVLGVLVITCPGLVTLIIRVFNLFVEVLGTVTNLVPEVVVMVFPVATAFSKFFKLTFIGISPFNESRD